MTATLAAVVGLWASLLEPPAEYANFTREVVPVAKYVCADFDVEVYSQRNGPDTHQRVMMAVPRGLKGKAPCVIAPFYFPEAMLGFNPKDESLESDLAPEGTNLTFYAGISYMSDLTRRGYVTISADAYHLTYRNHVCSWWAAVLGCSGSPWRRVGCALKEDWPQWTGVGKLTFDTRLLVDFAAADPRVDISRVGMIGHSLGGKMAFYAGMTDDRVKVVVASDFGLGWAQTNWGDCWYFGDKLAKMRAQGFSNVDLLSASGGRPFCLIAGKYDDADSGNLMKAATGYDGVGDRLLFLRHGTGHRPPAEVTARGYRFLDTYLE